MTFQTAGSSPETDIIHGIIRFHYLEKWIDRHVSAQQKHQAGVEEGRWRWWSSKRTSDKLGSLLLTANYWADTTVIGAARESPGTHVDAQPTVKYPRVVIWSSKPDRRYPENIISTFRCSIDHWRSIIKKGIFYTSRGMPAWKIKWFNRFLYEYFKSIRIRCPFIKPTPF